MIEARVEEEEYEVLDLHQSFRVVAMQDLGPRRMTAIVLENTKTNQVRFVRAELNDASSGEQKGIRFVQLGLDVIPTLTKASPLIKFRSVAKMDFITGKNY